MRYSNNHPTVIATSRLGCDVLNSIEEVARFIFTEGVTGDIYMADSQGKAFLTTNGIFVDYVWSEDYRKELLALIGDRQKRALDYIEKLFAPPSKKNRINAYMYESACREEEDHNDDDDNEREVFRNYLD